MKFFRMINLVLTAIFDVWGYIAGLIFFAVAIAKNKMVSGQSYLYPLIPFHFKKLAYDNVFVICTVHVFFIAAPIILRLNAY